MTRRLGASAHYLPPKPGALPLENGFPLNNVRVRGQAGPYTQHKRDGVPCGTGRRFGHAWRDVMRLSIRTSKYAWGTLRHCVVSSR